MPVSDDEHDRMLANAAAAVEAMEKKYQDAMRMLTAAAISSDRHLLIYDGCLARVNMYETVMVRDEAKGALRISVRPKQ